MSPDPTPETRESDIVRQLAVAKDAARRLATTDPQLRRQGLLAMADGLETHASRLLEANRIDFEAGEKAGLEPSLLDRIHLDRRRVQNAVAVFRAVAAEPDPVAIPDESTRLESGLEIVRIRVPLGVVGMVYEGRAHLALESLPVVLKAGNAAVVQAGRESWHTQAAMAEILSEAGLVAGLPVGFLEVLDGHVSHSLLTLLDRGDLVDLVLCRGARPFVDRILEASRVPVLWHGPGVCHLYVHRDADLELAERLVCHGKLENPASPTSLECLLVDRSIAGALAERLAPRFAAEGVEVRTSEGGFPIWAPLGVSTVMATQADWGAEFRRKVLALRLVEDQDEAHDHIFKYGSGHSEAICTRSLGAARRFQREVDAACVYVNASTHLSQGESLGLGRDLGVSTGKLHVRGPISSRYLTTFKYLVTGEGHLRG